MSSPSPASPVNTDVSDIINQITVQGDEVRKLKTSKASKVKSLGFLNKTNILRTEKNANVKAGGGRGY